MRASIVCKRGHPKDVGKACPQCKALLRRARLKGERIHTKHKQAFEVRSFPPGPELRRLKKKHNPTDAEWLAVQAAAHQIGAYLHQKATDGGKRFEQRSAWDIIEEATGDDVRRFQQLCAMATLQHAVWDKRKTERTGQGITFSVDMVRRVRRAAKETPSATMIAAKLGISQSAVDKILRGITHGEVAA